MPLPFTPSIPYPIPVSVFPPDLQARAAKLPMAEADRDMMIMRIEQRRTSLAKLQDSISTAAADGSVDGEIEPVDVQGLKIRYRRDRDWILWEEQLLVRNDQLLRMYDDRWNVATGIMNVYPLDAVTK